MPGRPFGRRRRSPAPRSNSAPKTSATSPGSSAASDRGREGYGAFDIEILAEINHAPRLTLDEIVAAAEHYRSEGADVIDVGCDPGGRWDGVGPAVEELRRRGFRVSIDSFRPRSRSATPSPPVPSWSSASTRRTAPHARSWGVEVVVDPRPPRAPGTDSTRPIRDLRDQGVPFRIDPILEPIGFGFAASLGRYLEARRRYPDVPVMMGDRQPHGIDRRRLGRASTRC